MLLSKFLLSKSNKYYLGKRGIDYGLLFVTKTGLEKSILDATGSLRTYLEDNNYHNYKRQQQGQESKIIRDCYLITGNDSYVKTNASLYRPITKNGDPRIWVYKLKNYATASDQIAFIIFNQELYIFNISLLDLSINNILNDLINNSEKVAKELLYKLREISRQGRLKSICAGNTGIGMTIESILNIAPNSSPEPDYKGIEIKSARLRDHLHRNTLFAQVPNWSDSKLKSSLEIIKCYGYERNNDLKLYCTLNSKKINSQGLFLHIDLDDDIVHERHIIDGNVVVWLGKTLRNKLITKHKETFWIHAESSVENDQEFFYLRSITHTKKPLSNQFLPLIEQGIITIDHLIKCKNKIESAQEKGPLFKINYRHLNLLFPEPKNYQL